MKKWIVIVLTALMLTGCAARETMETVADEWVRSAAAPVAELHLTLPEEAAAPVSESENGALYQCDGYEIYVQTLESGDLDATLRLVTGYGREDLTLIETRISGGKRWDLVWSCMGEAGDQVGRACVLDDGNYHYVLAVLAEAERAMEFESAWEELFGGYSLG